MSQRFLRCVSALVVVVGAVALAGVGCESTNKDKEAEKRDKHAAKQEQRAREREQASRSDSPDQVIGHHDTTRDRDTGRTSRGLDEIPTTAKRVDEGDATRLTHSPTRDGTLYVYDADADRVILVTRVRRDERFVLDPDANRATIDGRTVLGTGLNARHRYRLYFDDRGLAS